MNMNALFKLISRYGLGYINYMLFKDDRRVPLDSLDETANLEDVAFFDKEGNITLLCSYNS